MKCVAFRRPSNVTDYCHRIWSNGSYNTVDFALFTEKQAYNQKKNLLLLLPDFRDLVRASILIKITQCQDLDPTLLQNHTTDFDETLHVAWVWLPEGFSNSGRSGYSLVQKKGGRRPP